MGYPASAHLLSLAGIMGHRRECPLTRGTRLVKPRVRSCRMIYSTALHRLNYRLLWDKKLRIALLTVITFMALC
jgi:hypothetical protein